MEKNNELDKCVMCHKETTEPKNKHVDLRINYVDGAGQLCDECYEKVYGGK